MFFKALVTLPTLGDWDIFVTFFGNFGTVIKTISTSPVSTGPAGRQCETKKHARRAINSIQRLKNLKIDFREF